MIEAAVQGDDQWVVFGVHAVGDIGYCSKALVQAGRVHRNGNALAVERATLEFVRGGQRRRSKVYIDESRQGPTGTSQEHNRDYGVGGRVMRKAKGKMGSLWIVRCGAKCDRV